MNTRTITSIENKGEANNVVFTVTFSLYLLYVISFFLHIPARLPWLAQIRPDFLLATILAALLLMDKVKFRKYLDSRSARAFGIFLLYVLISIPFVKWPGSFFRENIVSFIKAISFLYFTLFIIDSPKRLKIFINLFVVCQLFRILEPVYLHISEGYWGDATYIGGGVFKDRLSGAPSDYINPNGLAFVVAMVFPFLHYLWFQSNVVLKLLYFSLLPILIYALVLTMSRSGAIALAIVFLGIFKQSKKKWSLAAILLSVVAIGWVNMDESQRQRYLSLTGNQNVMFHDSAVGRVKGILEDFDLAMDRPLFGHGVGTSGEAIANTRGKYQLSHNLYAEVWIEVGLAGLVLYILFLLKVYQDMRQLKTNVLGKSKRTYYGNEDIDSYFVKLVRIYEPVFWMLIVFSIAQYGLSEWHWYIFVGLMLASKRIRDDEKWRDSTAKLG